MEDTNNIKIIFEDEFLLAIDKPSGLVVHADGRTEEKTLVDWVKTNLPNLEKIGNPHTLDSGRYTERWGIVNRLDRDTSGVILIAKDSDTFSNLQKQFQDRTIAKEYLAEVEGQVDVEKLLREKRIFISPPFEGGVRGGYKITEPISRHKKDPRIWVFGSGEGARKTVRDAETHFQLLPPCDARGEAGQGSTFVKFYPKTGRTHQLRIHALFLGHPIVGDKKYGNSETAKRLMLHAQSLEFVHPHTKEKIKIESQITF